MDTSVLIVDDDPAVGELLSRYLTPRGYAVKMIHDGSALSGELAVERPSLVVLDVMMPGLDGLNTLADLRRTGDDIPVIIVTARDSVQDRVAGLEGGADDYIVKPFEPRELMARIDSVLRRDVSAPLPVMPPSSETGDVFTFGRFRFDSLSRRLFSDGAPQTLRESELALLNVFVRHPYRVMGREYLHHLLRGESLHFRDRGFDVPIWRLRRLIEDDPSNPRHLQTVRGKGYVFVPNIETA